MKILIVSDQPTHPTTAGNRRFIVNQTELFRSMGHDVYFLFVDGIYINDGDLNLMNKYWQDKIIHYNTSIFYKAKLKLVSEFRKIFHHKHYKCDTIYPSGLTNFLEKIQKTNKFDICITNYYYMTKFFEKVSFPLKAITTHDYFAFKDLHTGSKNAWMLTTANEEAKGLQRCPHIFALNTEEAVYFSKISPCSQIYCIFSYYDYKPSTTVGNKNILFFSGPNEYNVNGLKWFLDNIFPSIIKAEPEVNLVIGGKICEMLNEYKEHPHIKLFGPVDNAECFYSLGDVVINPTYQGTGLKIKTFEGVAYDKVTMTHPHSVVGIYSASEAPLFSSKDPYEWCSFLTQLWSDPQNIINLKKRNKTYITKMQNFVRSEYERFFKSEKLKISTKTIID